MIERGGGDVVASCLCVVYINGGTLLNIIIPWKESKNANKWCL